MESSTATATALLPALGYDAVCAAVGRAVETGRTIREVVLGEGLLDEREFEELLSPEAVMRLGSPAGPASGPVTVEQHYGVRS